MRPVLRFHHPIADGARQPSPALCVAIERESGGAVHRANLRPDDYWLIWPDLPAPATAEAGG